MKSGLLQCNGIVGGGIAIATGAGWTIKLQGSNLVSVAFFGDGAMNRGSFHEALNIASIWKLPVVYICENNQYAISAPSSEFVAAEKFEKRAVAYNLPGYAVDGNDVVEVYKKAKMLIENARNGEGPSLLVCHTCRQRAHDESDPQIYRTKEDIEKCKRSDPIPRFISQALKNSWLSENDIETVDQATEKEISIAAEFALDSPLPNPKDALNDVFVEEVKL
jgi:TPP-dependent pyruvate/acetoin dehydrogenase alpha subunit